MPTKRPITVSALRIVTEVDDAASARAHEERYGLYVEEEITVPVADYGVTQTVGSGGLWDMQPGANKSYLKEVAEEEYDTLKTILKRMGVKQVPALSTAKWVNR